MELTTELIFQLKQSCEVYQHLLERFGDKITTMKKETKTAIVATMDEISIAVENIIQESNKVEMCL